jgi:hypothetical protein
MSTKTNYVSPADMFEELLISINNGKMTERLGGMVILVSTRFATHPMFGGYKHIREELIHNGILACCKSFKSFRPNRNLIISRDPVTNEVTESQPVLWDGIVVKYDHNLHYSPFNFFSTVIKNSNIQYLKKYYQHKNLINELLIEQQMLPDWGYTDMIKDRQKASCEVDDVDLVEVDFVIEEEDEPTEDSLDDTSDSLDDLPINIDSMEVSEVDDILVDESNPLGITWTNR